MSTVDSKLDINLKLNATTFSVQAPEARKTLKVSLTPHLTTHHSSPLTPLTRVKKDADSLFEVLVPVGGKVEVDLEVDGVEGLTGCASEWEAEGYIKEECVKAFKRNRATLCLERVDTPVINTLTLHPTAAAASRAAILASALPHDIPIAYLTKLEIALTWVGGIVGVGVAGTTESQSSSASADDVLLLTDDEKGETYLPQASAHKYATGPLPQWLKEQLGLATTKLFRLELIKRFPLIFDPAFPAYLSRCTPPPSLELAFSHCLSLAQTHSTPLFEQGKERLQSIITSQAALVAHRRAVVEAMLIKATGSKRQKIASGPLGDTLPSTDEPTTDSISIASEAMPVVTEEKGPTLSSIILQSLGQIGRDRWTRARTYGRGRLSCHGIKLVGEGEATLEVPETVEDQHTIQLFSSIPTAVPLPHTGLFDDSMLDDSDNDDFLADSDDEGAASWDDQDLTDDDIIEEQGHMLSGPWRTPAYPSTISPGTQVEDESSDIVVHSFCQSSKRPHQHPNQPVLYSPDHTFDQDMLDVSDSDDLDTTLSLLSLEDIQTSDSLGSQPPTLACAAVPHTGHTLIRESTSFDSLEDLFDDDDLLDMDGCKDPGQLSLVQYPYSGHRLPYAAAAPYQLSHPMDPEPVREVDGLSDLEELEVIPEDVLNHSADMLDSDDDL